MPELLMIELRELELYSRCTLGFRRQSDGVIDANHAVAYDGCLETAAMLQRLENAGNPGKLHQMAAWLEESKPSKAH